MKIRPMGAELLH